MDGTLIKVELPAVANERDRQSYSCSKRAHVANERDRQTFSCLKRAHNQVRIVGNSIVNLFVAE